MKDRLMKTFRLVIILAIMMLITACNTADISGMDNKIGINGIVFGDEIKASYGDSVQDHPTYTYNRNEVLFTTEDNKVSRMEWDRYTDIDGNEANEIGLYIVHDNNRLTTYEEIIEYFKSIGVDNENDIIEYTNDAYEVRISYEDNVVNYIRVIEKK